ncbi:MAG: TIM barrel protein [Candidatus Omnitrophica bacterium]|nr:TIM barrel protein [Candidatus Omnitrophota bacterium]
MNENPIHSHYSNRRRFLQMTAAGASALAFSPSKTQAAAPGVKMFKNLSGGHIGLNANQKEAIELAAKYGFGGVTPHIGELSKMSAEQRKEITALMQEKGLRWGAGGLSVNFRGDEETFKKSLAAYPDEAKLMHDLSISRVATWIMPGNNDLTYLENFEMHRRRLKECARILKDHGVRLGLEFVGPRDTRKRFRFAFVCTQREMLELCDAIGTGNMGLLLDCWHWYTSHGTAEELAQLTNEQIVLVHVNDAPPDIPIDEQQDLKRQLPCTSGVIDMKAFINGLYKIGYDGPVECEPFDNELRKMETEPKLEKTIAALDRTFKLIEA